MQTLAVVVRTIEMDLFWRRNLPEILNVNVSHATQFCADSAIKHVIGMAGVGGFVDRNTMILKMGGCNIVLVINVKGFPVGLHHVTRQAKRSLFRFLKVFREPQTARDYRQKK